jgi:twitching motility protein PilT
MSLNIDAILKIAQKIGASDTHLKVGRPPCYRIDGKIKQIKDIPPLSNEDLESIVKTILKTEDKFNELLEKKNVDPAYSSEAGRYRVNIFYQRGTYSIVLRTIPTTIPNIEDINLPEVIKEISLEERGLILVTGITGSGKSTTLASMINYINENKNAHILTIEDPIEFVHEDKKCIVNQREIGQDATTFADALRAALRQDPDIILVGEMRDLETIETALHAAETGHLVMSTLHTLDAKETINRIISQYPPHHQEQVRIQLSEVLKAVISQRLLPKKEGKGRVPAIEILRTSARVKECIKVKEKTPELTDAMIQGHITVGMQTFDQSLLGLFKKGIISYEEAVKNANNPNDFALMVQGIGGGSAEISDDEEEISKF